MRKDTLPPRAIFDIMHSGEHKALTQSIAYFLFGTLLVGINFGWYIPIERILRADIAAEEANAAEKAASAATSFIDVKVSNLRVIARAVSDTLDAPENKELAAVLLREPAFNRVFIAGADGKETFVADRFRTVFPDEYKTIADRTVFEQAKQDGVSFGTVQITERFEPIVTVAVPIFSSSGAFLGILGADLSAKSVFESVSTITIGGRGGVYVVDNSGILIAHKDVSLVLKNTNYSGRAIITETFRSGKATSAEDDRFTYENEEGASVRSAGAFVPGVLWVAVFEDPENAALRILLMLRILVAAIIGVGLVSFYFLRRINVNLARAERLLSGEKNRLDSILSSIGDGLFVIDKNRVVTLANKTAETVFGLAAGKAIGRNIAEIASLMKGGVPVVEEDSPINRVFDEGEILRIPLEDSLAYRLPQGGEMPVTMTLAPLFDGKRKGDPIAGAIIVFRDATAAKKIQEETKSRAEELEQLNSFMIGRELKMVELKKEIQALKEKSEIRNKEFETNQKH